MDMLHDKSAAITNQLYRIAIDAVKRLDEVLAHTKRCQDLFQPEVASFRIQLKEVCEKLIFSSNVKIAEKAEEFLWRKVYYEVINYVKLQRKKSDGYTDNAVKLHISSGIGTYHLLIKRLHSYAANDLNQSINQLKINKSLFKFHIALGDLTRYLADFSSSEYRTSAENYYKDAYIINSNAGLPFNQLGTLYTGYSYGLDSVFYYMRGLLTERPFEGTESNLLRLLERNRKTYTDITLNSSHDSQAAKVKKFIIYFMRLVEIFYSSPNSESGLQELCPDMLQDLPECLPPHKILLALPSFEYSPKYLCPELCYKIAVILQMCYMHLQSKGNPLTTAAVAFLFAFMSQLTLYCISACNTLLPQLLSTSSKTNQNIPDTPNAIIKDTKTAPRSYRRRRKNTDCDDNSDMSEDDNDDEDDFEDDEVESLSMSLESDLEMSDSIDGDDLDVLSESGDGKDDSLMDSTTARLNASAELALQVVELALEENPTEEANGPAEDKQSDSPQGNINILHILGHKGYLFAIKNFCDWLKSAPDFLKSCAASSKMLWPRLASLDNLLHTDVVQFLTAKSRPEILADINPSDVCDSWIQKHLLPEDVLIQNFPGLSDIHYSIDFTANCKTTLNNFEQMLLRIQCIHDFCLFLANNCPDLEISYDQTTELLTVPNELEESAVTNQIWMNTPATESYEENKKELMQNMTQLWLKAEVNDLETKLKINSSKSFSPYLVPHSAVLVHNLPSVRHLASAKKFVVVVPRTVIETLDSLKKTSMKAREASRWLESELKRGNRFLRAQNQHEKLSLSPLKYPKRKDKQLWDTYQIFECCNYLCQNKFIPSNEEKSVKNVPIVTMLVSKVKGGANSDVELDIDSVQGVASSIGVEIQDVKVFYSQVFKRHSKGKR